MDTTDLRPGDVVTRRVSGPNGATHQDWTGVVIRKLTTRYLVKWTLPSGLVIERPARRIEGTRAFH